MVHIVVFHAMLASIWLVRQQGVAWKTGLGVEKLLIVKVIDTKRTCKTKLNVWRKTAIMRFRKNGMFDIAKLQRTSGK